MVFLAASMWILWDFLHLDSVFFFLFSLDVRLPLWGKGLILSLFF